MNVIDQHITDRSALYNCDCVELARSMPDNSVDFSVYSPPFISLYVFSNSERDMGNNADDATFWQHYKYLIAEHYRITKPGRLVAIHCMNLPTAKAREGYIGIKDFRGDIIRAHQEAGFIYHSEVCIWKDPVIAQQRTKAIGLLHKQLIKDRSMSRMGIPDYLVVMRKPGENEEEIAGYLERFIGTDGELDVSRDAYKQHSRDVIADGGKPWPFEMWRSVLIWQRYASPVWMDINQTRTLQYRSARETDDERHISPLQLDVIERSLEMWSAPGDLVYTPFLGIGSEAYCALKMGRRAIGSELKPSYFRVAINNCQDAETVAVESQLDLLGVEAAA